MSEEHNNQSEDKVKSETQSDSIDFTEVYPLYNDELMEERKTYKDLFREIVDTGLCSGDGACIAACPAFVLEFQNKRPVIVDEEGCIKCGICTAACSRYTGLETTSRDIHLESIGDYTSLWQAFALNDEVRSEGQSGGVATALMICAVEENMVEAALVLQAEGDAMTSKSKIAYNKEEIIKAQKSKYVTFPSLAAVNLVRKNRIESFVYVGTPCQITGLKYLINQRLDGLYHRARYIIGLFCMESFMPQPLAEIFRERTGGLDYAEASRVDINKGRLVIHHPGRPEKPYRIRLRHFDKAMRPGCKACTDLTSEDADISVGNVGAKPKHTVVIVRTHAGEELLNKAIEKGYISAEPMVDTEFQLILNLNRMKKKERARSTDSLIP
ncbi:MAG: Coenzyme F420 hydrogenase/dehydrogenase, beta subunit C-terminal domain [Candidatus Kariarchaeaceae archaeon]